MIHIWLPTQHAPLRLWQPTTQTWQHADNWQELATLASLQHTKSKTLQACLYFPSVHLLKLQPNLSASQLKALGEMGRRYLFEEISIGAVDDLQVKIPPTPQGSEPPTLFGLHATAQSQWLQAAALVGIEIVGLLPDFSLLPISPILANATDSGSFEGFEGIAAVYYEDAHTALLRWADYQGLAITTLMLALTKMPQIHNLHLITPTTVPSPDNLPNGVNIVQTSLAPTPVSDVTRHDLNFAQTHQGTTVPAYAKIIMSLLFFALLTTFITDGLRWFYYDHAQKQAQILLSQQYNQWFPNEKLNTKLSLQRQLADKLVTQTDVQPSVLSTLATIQPILQQYQLTARQLNFQNNHLQLQLIGNDTHKLNQAVADISQKGIKAKLGQINNAAPASAATASETAPPATTPLAMIEIDL